MTGMMEANGTISQQAVAEFSDVSDIALAANTTLGNLVSCLVNAPLGRGEITRAAFARHTLMDVVPLTVAEMAGEWSTFETSSLL